MVHVYQNDGKTSTAKNHCCPATLLSVDSKTFEKLPNNRVVNHIKKCGFFSKFQYSFRSSQSTADLLPEVSNRIGRVFDWFVAAQPIALNISKTFAGLPHKVKSYGILVLVFGHILHFLGNRRFGVVLDQKLLQKYSTDT